MDINITLFIQAFHFLVAYCILEKLLFRPTVTTIQKEKKEYNDILLAIKNQQAVVKSKEDLKIQRWNDIKKIFAQTVPHIPFKEHMISTPHLEPIPTLNKQNQQEQQQTLQNFLIKRLRNAS